MGTSSVKTSCVILFMLVLYDAVGPVPSGVISLSQIVKFSHACLGMRRLLSSYYIFYQDPSLSGISEGLMAAASFPDVRLCVHPHAFVASVLVGQACPGLVCAFLKPLIQCAATRAEHGTWAQTLKVVYTVTTCRMKK